MHKDKLFDVVLFLVLFAALVVGYLVWHSKKTPTEVETLVYRNDQYGFSVQLPETWRGFKIEETQKEIYAGEAGVAGHFPSIEIIHPTSTKEHPRQNIPVFVFTQDQWKHIGHENADWGVGAAPIPPSELARNSVYVFALPARYNYAFITGWEEVQQIIESKPFSTFNPISAVPTSVDISSWKTYRNEKYGFEIMSPPSWVVSSGTDFIFIEEATSTFEHPLISIEIIENSKQRQLSEMDEFKRINFEKECKTITFGDYSAFDCNPAVTFAGERNIIIPKGDIVISISDSIESDISNWIVSTFRFTN